MNCLIYARVSTQEQAEQDLSIPAQLQAAREYARLRGWTVVEEFVEPGASAKTTERPALQRLLAAVQRDDLKVDVLLVHKIDRLARNVYDHAMIRSLLKTRGVRIASVVENVDDSTSGQLVENIMASIAQFYSSNLAEEVKKGMRMLVQRGGWPHKAPRGYLNIKDRAEGNRVEPHPKEAKAVQQAFERYATGWLSLKDIATGLAKDGVTSGRGGPIPTAYVHRMLSNPFYVGKVRWKDTESVGLHQPLIRSQLFARVQDVLHRRFRDPGAKGSVNGFTLRGLAICASCRGRMTGGWQRSSRTSRRRFGYYRCSRRTYDKNLCPAGKGCPVELAHRGVSEICSRFPITSETADMILNAVHQQLDRRDATAQTRIASLRATATKLAAKELALTEAFVAETVSSSACKSTAAKLKADRDQVESELRTLNHNSADIFARISDIIARAGTVAALRDQLNDERRLSLLRSVFAAIVLNEEGVVGFNFRAPFDVLFCQEVGGTGFLTTLHDASRHVDATARQLLTFADVDVSLTVANPAMSQPTGITKMLAPLKRASMPEPDVSSAVQ